MSAHDKKCEYVLMANNPHGHCWCKERALAVELAAVKARLAGAGRLLRIVEDADYMSHIPKDEIRGWLGTADSADGAT